MSDFPHLTATSQLDREFIETRLFPLSDTLRDGEVADRRLNGLALYSLFYEPSLLTRTSFERAMGLLGGQVYHTEDASQFYPVSNASHIDNVINILASLRIDVVVLRSSARASSSAPSSPTPSPSSTAAAKMTTPRRRSLTSTP